MRTRFRLPLVIAISILPSVFGNLSAQDTKPQPTQCSVVRVLQNGSIQVQIDGTSYLAITADQARENLKLKADLETAQNLIRLKDAEIASHNQEIDRYERTLNLKNETLGDKNEALTLKNDAIEQLKSLRDDYRELADTYRKAQGGKWFSISAGVGATSESEAAALVGIGIKRFRVWAFAQERNSGVMAGVEFPIF
jgi:hypothetical protein